MTDEARLNSLGGGSPFVAATSFDLRQVGYERAEYSLSGLAHAYDLTDGGLVTVGQADFTTRILIYRPADAVLFNGTVWVEWLNVSGGVDAAPGWTFAHREIIRRGAAWVGVSAQHIGIEGGTSILGFTSPGLVGFHPSRYGALHHPGDRFSYDIYTQASEAVRHAGGTILEDLVIERVLGMGESQSAFRLTTYVNLIDPVARALDGFLVHARGKSSAPLDDTSGPRRGMEGDPVRFRDDLRVPVLCVESEGDMVVLDYRASRQEDREYLVVWEMAGTSHADVYAFVAGPLDSGRLPIEELARASLPVRTVVGVQLDQLVNAGPQHLVVKAALWHLDRWVGVGLRPPAGARLEMDDGDFVRDEHGNARGGIRTPHVDVPTSVLSGLGNRGHPIAPLCGRTVPFDEATLRSLYPTKATYLDGFAAATEAAVTAGFVLADDSDETTAIAALNSPV